MTTDIQSAVDVLMADGVIAYPTETLPGLGCLPTSETAIYRILAIKQRTADKGLILLVSDIDQIRPWVAPLDQSMEQRLRQKTDLPTTWLIPAGEKNFPLIQGTHDKLAVRITTHPTAIKLCNLINQPIVSTSINRAGDPPATQLDEIPAAILDQLDLVLDGKKGTGSQSRIRDLVTNKLLR